MVLHPLQNDRFRLGSLSKGISVRHVRSELERHIRSEDVMFDHDLEPMIGFSHSDAERVKMLLAVSTSILPLALLSGAALSSSIR